MIHFLDHESLETCMRGAFLDQGGLFSYISPDARVPRSHPLRNIRELVREVLSELSRALGELAAVQRRRAQLAFVHFLHAKRHFDCVSCFSAAFGRLEEFPEFVAFLMDRGNYLAH